MKFFFIAVMGSMLGFGSKAQLFIHGSVQKAVENHTVDILFKPTLGNTADEAIDYLQFSISLPSAIAVNVNAYPVGVGNLAGKVFSAFPKYTEATTGETVYTWNMTNAGGAAMTWSANTEFIGIKIQFTGNPGATSRVRLLDITNTGTLGGGTNNNTYWFITTNNAGDVTDYAALYYAKAGISSLGTYSSLDQYVETDPTVPLPIALLSFSGYKDGAINQLRWTTGTEQNNAGFEVQRSPDGVSYSPIGFVNSLANGGNSSNQLNYTFADNNVSGSKQFYRLRQVDISGRSKLSNIILIRSDKPAVLTINGMFPNPATTMLNLMVGSPARDKISVVITDISGKTVMQQSLIVETGNNTLPVNISTLAGGTYIVKMISSDGEVTTGKFVKR